MQAAADTDPNRQCTPPFTAPSVLPVQVTTISASPQAPGHLPSSQILFIAAIRQTNRYQRWMRTSRPSGIAAISSVRKGLKLGGQESRSFTSWRVVATHSRPLSPAPPWHPTCVMSDSKPGTVLFACVHNAGSSQMANAYFNALSDASRARSYSAGTQPGDSVHLVLQEVRAWPGRGVSSCWHRRICSATAIS